MSIGGSHAVWRLVKNCRCRRSARSSIDKASPHIQLERSRDFTGVRWRRIGRNQDGCKNGSRKAVSLATIRGAAERVPPSELLEEPAAKRRHRWPLGDDLGADEPVRAERLQLDLERRAKPPGRDVRVHQRPERERDAELLRSRFE